MHQTSEVFERVLLCAFKLILGSKLLAREGAETSEVFEANCERLSIQYDALPVDGN